jgi:RNA recognition motif-containing protein
MFSQFGKILDVVALKTLRMRGQAWVVFADVAAATNAKNTMQGFPFFEKPIVSVELRPGSSSSSINSSWLGGKIDACTDVAKGVQEATPAAPAAAAVAAVYDAALVAASLQTAGNCRQQHSAGSRAQWLEFEAAAAINSAICSLCCGSG